MKIIDCIQGSEQWENLRKGIPTASQFGRIITPARLQFASGAKTYACELVAERLNVASTDELPTFWMDRGTEMEPLARAEFAATVNPRVSEVGFVLSDCGKWGYSPDGFVGTDELLEIKCPKAETLIGYHAAENLPNEHLMQIQGGLWVTGRKVCHFYAWHPELEPFHQKIVASPKVFEAFEKNMPKFLALVDDIESKVKRRVRADLQGHYETVEAEL